MAVYIIATIITILLAYCAQHIKINDPHSIINTWCAKKLFRMLTPIPLFMVAALRYNVGTDYPYTYTQRFLWRLNGYDLSSIFEFGFIKLIDGIQIFTRDPHWLFVMCAVIFSIFTALAIYEQSCDYAISFAIIVIAGYYFAYLNLMRNYVALAIVLYALKYIEKREPIKYILWTLLATTIHTSVIVYLPLYYIYSIKINRWLVLGIVVVAGLALPIIDTVARYVVGFTDYGWYYNLSNSNVVPQITYLIISLTILAIQIIAYRRMKDNMLYQFHLKIEMVITIIGISSFTVPMIRRFILIPIFSQILVIPYIKKYRINRHIKSIFLLTLYAVLILTTYRQITAQEMHSVLPYQTIFSR